MDKPSDRSSGFVANVVKLVGGNAFAQALAILILPVLTRFFAPSAFGIAALFTSITGVFGVMACLRYELAIMLPESDGEAANVLGLCVIVAFVVSGILALVVALGGDGVVALLNAPGLAPYLWLVPLAVFLNGVYLALTYWNSRSRQFGRVSLAQALSSIAAQTTKLLAGLGGLVSAAALIVAGILGLAVSTGTLGSALWRHDRPLLRKNLRWRGMLAGMQRYRKFPLFGSWSILLNTMSQQLPVWVLSAYFSATEVGYFSLSRIVLGAPVVLIGGAIAQVFYQKACEVKSDRRDFALAVDVIFTRLVSLGIFPLLLVMVVGQELFALVFGTGWGEAGLYTQILALWIFFQFVSVPISNVFSVLERQGSLLAFNVVLFVTRLLSLVLGGMTGDIHLTLALFAGTGVVCYVFYCLWILTLAGLAAMRGLAVLGRYGLLSAPFILAVVLLEHLAGLAGPWLLVVALVVTLFYYLVIVEQDAELRAMRQRLLQRFKPVR